jgi:hypothetical protein
LFELQFSQNRSQMTMGDELVLEIDAVHGANFKLLPLPDDLDFSPFEIKKVERVPARQQGGTVREGYRIVLTVFELGDFTLSPFIVSFKDAGDKAGQVLTDEVHVSVVSVGRKETDTDDIRGIKTPLRLSGFWLETINRWWLWSLIAVTLACVIGFVLRKRRKMIDPESLLPPYQRALLRLKRLEASDHLRTGRCKLYFTELSRILERYLIEQISIGSEESTTEEWMAAMQSSRLSSTCRKKVQQVLEISDLAKFAKWVPPGDDCQEALVKAREIVQETRPSKETEKAASENR